MNLTMYDVIVIGAGLSGSYTAFRLAELGYQVIVLEQKEEANDNTCCTGIISTECFISFNLDATIFRQVNSAKFFAPCSQFTRLYRESPQAYIVDRASLDKSLKERAQANGADYLFSAPVIAVTPELDYASVTVDHQGKQRVLTAQAIVLACGFGCELPEKIGLGKIADSVFGAQAEVETKDIDEIEVYLDQKLFPGFFGWLVPTSNGKGLAGLLVPEDPDSYLRNFLCHLQAQGKIASAEADVKFGTIPLGSLPRTCGDRVIVVGEAAGQVKPTTGGGICYGLLCADIAADCLHQAFLSNDFSVAKLCSYDKQWRAKLNRELQTGYRMRRFYKKLSNRRIDHLFHIMNNNSIPKFITEWQDFSFDWHGQLILGMLKHLTIGMPLFIHRKSISRGNHE